MKKQTKCRFDIMETIKFLTIMETLEMCKRTERLS